MIYNYLWYEMYENQDNYVISKHFEHMSMFIFTLSSIMLSTYPDTHTIRYNGNYLHL